MKDRYVVFEGVEGMRYVDGDINGGFTLKEAREYAKNSRSEVVLIWKEEKRYFKGEEQR